MKVSMVRTDPFRTDPFLTFPFLKAEAQWRAWLRVERLLGEWWIGEDSAAGLARRSPLID